jgi:cyanate lyase
MKTIKEILAPRTASLLTERLDERNMNYRELAHQINASNAHVRLILKGEMAASDMMFRKIINALDIDEKVAHRARVSDKRSRESDKKDRQPVRGKILPMDPLMIRLKNVWKMLEPLKRAELVQVAETFLESQNSKQES